MITLPMIIFIVVFWCVHSAYLDHIREKARKKEVPNSAFPLWKNPR